MKVKMAEVLLMPSSKAAPVSITRWRMPDSRCWKKLHVTPMRMIRPMGCVAALVNVANASGPPEIANNHQVRIARPAKDKATPLARWMIEAAMLGPHRQIVRCGESGRDRVLAMVRRLRAQVLIRQVSASKPNPVLTISRARAGPKSRVQGRRADGWVRRLDSCSG